MHFSAKCNSGRIAIQWFHIMHYLDYQYTKFQPYTFRVQKCVFLHDKRLWFPDYYVHSSIAIILMWNRELVALLNLYSWCLVMVERLFLAQGLSAVCYYGIS